MRTAARHSGCESFCSVPAIPPQSLAGCGQRFRRSAPQRDGRGRRYSGHRVQQGREGLRHRAGWRADQSGQLRSAHTRLPSAQWRFSLGKNRWCFAARSRWVRSTLSTDLERSISAETTLAAEARGAGLALLCFLQPVFGGSPLGGQTMHGRSARRFRSEVVMLSTALTGCPPAGDRSRALGLCT